MEFKKDVVIDLIGSIGGEDVSGRIVMAKIAR